MNTNAVVILNLSSLDSYSDAYGPDEAHALAGRMRGVVLDHYGPVYIVDQRWPLGSRHSEPRNSLVQQIQLARDIEWIHWDESSRDWEDFLREFAARLKDDGVRLVFLGGIWYDPGGSMGCVVEGMKILGKRLKVRVDDRIVGCIPEYKRP
jgi:hypothetical protein